MKNDIVKIRSHTLGVLLLQSDSFAAARHCDGMFKLTDYQKAQERLQKLQTLFEWTKKSRCVGEGIVSLGPMHAFLQTEWENLTETVSSRCQDISASPNISSIISGLETRASLLEMYQMEECSGSPPVYCLSAFANPRGILAALIRETVYTQQCDISQVTLHFQVYYKILKLVLTKTKALLSTDYSNMCFITHFFTITHKKTEFGKCDKGLM